jgi:putative hydrolase of the HAD superfamily
LFNKFETGEITESVFFDELKNLSGMENISHEAIRNAWNAMLIKFPKENYLMLKELKKNYNLFLLSNTNETHITAFKKTVEEVCPINEFENLFQKVYYSCRIHLRKPDAVCFLHVLNDSAATLEETIFIDDSIQHIAGARQIGMKAHFLEENVRTESLLKKLRLL